MDGTNVKFPEKKHGDKREVPRGRVADENPGVHMRPTAAAVYSLNWPYKHDAKFKQLLKYLNANIHPAASDAYTLDMPTRFSEDPFDLAVY